MFIAISQRLMENSSYVELREGLALDWGIFFGEYLKEYLPLPLSYEIEFSRYIPYVSGVILSGGNDISIIDNSKINNKRDSYETRIIELCIAHKIPLLGICHGAQIISYYFDSSFEKQIGHVGQHAIIADGKEYEVNSYHNYCITKLGDGLESLAQCDCTIEAFMHKEYDIYAMMWHIERKFGMQYRGVFDKWLEKLKEKVCK